MAFQQAVVGLAWTEVQRRVWTGDTFRTVLGGMGEGVREESRGVTRAPTFLACTAGLTVETFTEAGA